MNKILNNTLNNNQGFSLIELMIGAGLLMTTAWALADTILLNAKAQRNAISESEITMLFDRVQSITSAEWSCTASLAGSHYNGAITVKNPVNFSTVASEGNGSLQFWSMAQVRMQDVQSVEGQPGVLRGGLYLKAVKNMKVNIGSPVLSRLVQDIYFEANPDGSIARCYTTSDTVAAAQSACQLLGGTWHANEGNGVKCKLGNDNGNGNDG